MLLGAELYLGWPFAWHSVPSWCRPTAKPCSHAGERWTSLFQEIHPFHWSEYFTSEELGRAQCGCGAAL